MISIPKYKITSRYVTSGAEDFSLNGLLISFLLQCTGIEINHLLSTCINTARALLSIFAVPLRVRWLEVFCFSDIDLITASCRRSCVSITEINGFGICVPEYHQHCFTHCSGKWRRHWGRWSPTNWSWIRENRISQDDGCGLRFRQIGVMVGFRSRNRCSRCNN